ncbi:MAG: DUF72 domain-containing protein [Candidatus Lokiarchaeota archaeon]|nr:DUF72 domain-containing protein [Candidatus Lokiarchaeota archaeon]MBD3342251.1 DUF72 domain-containing protein [Candidatus Lokiarchaeota archaeon]
MIELQIGCAGWEYKDWKGPFYPRKMNNAEHLEYYSKFFGITEVNSTFYNLPWIEMVEGWHRKTPESFRFIVKVWQKITHEIKSEDLMERINQFFDRLLPLKSKIIGFLLQFPPWFKYSSDHLTRLQYLLDILPEHYAYFIELRDNSWFNEDIISKFIDGKKYILSTSYLEYLEPFFYDNQSTYYIRLIGDRKLDTFKAVQRKQEESMADLEGHIKIIKKKPKKYRIFIIVNNHFSGFAPETVNEIKKNYNLSYKKFTAQQKLSDFL